MGVKEVFQKLKAPCAKCPYKLGIVKTFVDPCPQCKAGGYRMFERLIKKGLGDSAGKG